MVQKNNQLINIVFDYILQKKIMCLQQLNANMIILSRQGESQEITSTLTKRSELLSSNQEEADTKVFLHTLQVLEESLVSKVHLRSPSADTDILVIALNLIPRMQLNRVCYDYGVRKHRNCLLLSDYQLPEDERKALIGFHPVTGNDYTSAIFGKGKGKCWKVMKSKEKFLIAFQQLGDDWQLPEALLNTLKVFTCNIYGSRKSTVNEARYELFMKKYTKGNKVIDFPLLPACKTSHNLHLEPCNYR